MAIRPAAISTCVGGEREPSDPHAASATTSQDLRTPNEVKQAVTGAGNADKGQVQMALARIHGLRGVPAQADAADAVAVALTHLLAAPMRAVAARAGAR